jgi:Ca-activated chloride channel family protein
VIPALAFDRSLVTVRNDEVIHALLELTAPTPADASRAPLDVVLVIDRSGSMSGRPLRAVVDACAALLRLAGPDDRIAVVTFDSSVDVVLPLAHHDAEAAGRTVRAIRPGGSTNLSGGWLRAAELLESGRRPGAVRRIVLLTDGHANNGVTDPDRLSTMVNAGTADEITSSFIGFADGHDETLLGALADAGRGNDYWCADSDAAAVFASEFEGLATVVAQNLSVTITANERVAAVRVLNDLPTTEAIDGSVRVSLGDAYAGETRRMVAAINLRPLPDHSEYDVAALDVRWTSVLGPTAQQSVVLPVRVTAAAVEEVHQAAADPRVMEQLGVLRAADLERAARLAADRGEFDDAARMLREGAERLRYVGRPDLAADLETSAGELSRGTWDQAAAKRLHSRAREKNRGRRSTYETSWDPTFDPSGPGVGGAGTGDPGGNPGITPPPADPGPLGSDPT